MLRAAISLVAILFVGCALAATIVQPAAWPMLAAALLLAFGCLYERRYHAAQSAGAWDEAFRPTGERFIDPETGRLMSAWLHPGTGERRYRDEGSPPGPAA